MDGDRQCAHRHWAVSSLRLDGKLWQINKCEHVELTAVLNSMIAAPILVTITGHAGGQ